MRPPLDPRQKEGASFRFLPEAENSISASSFFLFRRKPASLGFPAGVRGGRQAAPRKAQPTHAGTVASDQFDCQAAGESNGGPQAPASTMQIARSAYPFWGSARGLCPPRVQSSAACACPASAVFCQRQNTRRKWGIETPSPLTVFFGTFFVRTKKVHIHPAGGRVSWRRCPGPCLRPRSCFCGVPRPQPPSGAS